MLKKLTILIAVLSILTVGAPMSMANEIMLAQAQGVGVGGVGVGVGAPPETGSTKKGTGPLEGTTPQGKVVDTKPVQKPVPPPPVEEGGLSGGAIAGIVVVIGGLLGAAGGGGGGGGVAVTVSH